MPWVKEEDCIKCKICVNVCPVKNAIYLKENGYPYINNNICTRCGLCMEKCPRNAIRPNFENPALRGFGRGRGGGRMGGGFGKNRIW